ncbi:hypothetical protein AB1Y20_005882 [Prymnesium parvum]|uniref:PWI domain-containing protein n=1 Tax=Prymnesium parvum TaxID=97485 RepID=A0AB34J323_PRYPA|mmetsp:Transcript_22829/g.56774  ORF Transcript_22829/g.56774 Transcript_22829/m.56774 type:complete len:511 (+) Transcript_22829:154-1686(+)
MDSAAVQRLQHLVKEKLAEKMGHSDDVLPEYVMVMVQNGKPKSQMRADLEAFLGSKSRVFVDWLWDLLRTELGDAQPGKQDGKVKAAVLASSSSGRGAPPTSSREEKARKDGGVAARAPERREREEAVAGVSPRGGASRRDGARAEGGEHPAERRGLKRQIEEERRAREDDWSKWEENERQREQKKRQAVESDVPVDEAAAAAARAAAAAARAAAAASSSGAQASSKTKTAPPSQAEAQSAALSVEDRHAQQLQQALAAAQAAQRAAELATAAANAAAAANALQTSNGAAGGRGAARASDDDIVQFTVTLDGKPSGQRLRQPTSEDLSGITAYAASLDAALYRQPPTEGRGTGSKGGARGGHAGRAGAKGTGGKGWVVGAKGKFGGYGYAPMYAPAPTAYWDSGSWWQGSGKSTSKGGRAKGSPGAKGARGRGFGITNGRAARSLSWVAPGVTIAKPSKETPGPAGKSASAPSAASGTTMKTSASDKPRAKGGGKPHGWNTWTPVNQSEK